MIKLVLINIILSLNLMLSSCNTVTGFSKGVIDDVRAVIPGI
jgi:predicted small secreted protein|tara:strand:+ start:201 stop:326 length:126 start_codon:yes stop_codon:yes gene_type:complete